MSIVIFVGIKSGKFQVFANDHIIARNIHKNETSISFMEITKNIFSNNLLIVKKIFKQKSNANGCLKKNSIRIQRNIIIIVKKNWKIDKHDANAKLLISGVWNNSRILIEIVEGVDGART